MKQSIYSIFILFVVLTSLYAQEINESNWKSHPKIKESAELYDKVWDERGKYKTQERSCIGNNENLDITVRIYRDNKGKIRMYELFVKSDDTAAHGEYCYSATGILRFSWLTLESLGEVAIEKELYFDQKGNHLYTDARLRGLTWKDALPEKIKDPSVDFDNCHGGSNWSSHPKIKEVRKIYEKINEKVWKYNSQDRECEFDGGSNGIFATIYKDNNGVVRKYELDGGSDDSVAHGEYYYSSKGLLRFSFLVQRAVNGTHSERRNYFDTNNKLIYSDYRLIEGPGYPEWFEQSIKHPENDFKNLCPEKIKKGEVIIHHQYETLLYNIYQAQYAIMDNDLHAEIKAEPADDNRLDYYGKLDIELNGLGIKGIGSSSFAGNHHISKNPKDESERKIDSFPTVSLSAFNRSDIDHNHIKIKLKDDNVLVIEWTGVAPDLKYDNKKVNNIKIEIKCNMSNDLFDEP